MITKPQFESYSDVEDWLNARPQFSRDGKKATDFRPHKLVEFCHHLGQPERKGRYIHVAGTNGKGSTCSMIASVYQTAGYKTGLFTSPHIEHWRERIKIDGQPASETQLLAVFKEMAAVPGFEMLTYFELGTLAAILVFEREGVDVAVMETGMGGRLDATNIIVPLVSVITSIGLDHTEYLGSTIDAIAREKAGIIKANVPVVVGDLPDAALEVVRSVSEAMQSKLIQATDLTPHYSVESDEIILNHSEGTTRHRTDIPSVTSAINAAVAFSVVKVLDAHFDVHLDDILTGLSQAALRTGLKGRMERLHPTRNWYYDGAHNTEALQVLLLNLERLCPLHRWTVVFTMMSDKANSETLPLFRNLNKVVFYKSPSERGAAPEQIQAHLPQALVLSEEEIMNYIAPLTSEFVIFTGSFYFYNEVRRWISPLTVPNR